MSQAPRDDGTLEPKASTLGPCPGAAIEQLDLWQRFKIREVHCPGCQENAQLRALIARVVVVMDGSWDVLGTGEEEKLYTDLHAVVFKDAPP